jgi:hypothetical protein
MSGYCDTGLGGGDDCTIFSDPSSCWGPVWVRNTVPLPLKSEWLLARVIVKREHRARRQTL